MTVALVKAANLEVGLRSTDGYTSVIRGIDLEIGRGEIVGLVGESGSGKSVTARALLRLLPRDARVGGRVMFDGADVLRLTGRQLREFRLHRSGMILQDPRAAIDPLFTIESFLVEGLRRSERTNRSAAKDVALAALGDTGIRDPRRVMASRPAELSGGMLQRVMIASVLAKRPDLLVADEPTTALDVTIQAEVVALIKDLCRERDIAVLFITHDLALASALCERIMVIYAGRVVESQIASALFTEPLHPYTLGLIRARPRLDVRLGHLDAIPGRPPDPSSVPPGCAFHPRCRFAAGECREHLPGLVAVGDSGMSACMRIDEIKTDLLESARGSGLSHG